jgi:hypothetical protein
MVARYPVMRTPPWRWSCRKLLRGECEGRQCATLSPDICIEAQHSYDECTKTRFTVDLSGARSRRWKREVLSIGVHGFRFWTYGTPGETHPAGHAPSSINRRMPRCSRPRIRAISARNRRVLVQSGQRDSNHRHSAWETRALGCACARKCLALLRSGVVIPEPVPFVPVVSCKVCTSVYRRARIDEPSGAMNVARA